MLGAGPATLQNVGFFPQNARWLLRGGWEDLEAGCVRRWVKQVFPGIGKNWFFLLIPNPVWDGERLTSPWVTLALALPSPVPGRWCLGDPWGWGRLGDPWGYLGCTCSRTLGKNHPGLGWGWLWAQRGNGAGGFTCSARSQRAKHRPGQQQEICRNKCESLSQRRGFSVPPGGDLSPG